MQNDNAKLDNELAVLAAFALAYMVMNTDDKEVLEKIKEVVLKYNLIEAVNTSGESEMNATETVECFDKAIANIQDKIEEYNALER